MRPRIIMCLIVACSVNLNNGQSNNKSQNNSDWQVSLDLDIEPKIDEPGWARDNRECDNGLVSGPKGSAVDKTFGPFPGPVSFIGTGSDGFAFKGTKLTKGGLGDTKITLSFRGTDEAPRFYMATFCWEKHLGLRKPTGHIYPDFNSEEKCLQITSYC